MKNTMWGLAAGIALLASAGNAQAQRALPIAVEVRGGAAFPTGDFGDGLNTGYTFGGNATLGVSPLLGVYAGYSYNSFGVDDAGDVLGEELRINDRGFDAGVRASVPTLAVSLSPWVRAGLVYHDIEVNGDGGDFSSDSELGFEVGAGLEFPLGLLVSVTPGVSYTHYSIDGGDGSVDGDNLDVNHVRADIGLRIRL